jgi:hypothetical protein
MTNFDLLLLLALLTAKHNIADFIIQTNYQYQHKHIYGHVGGIVHAVIHGVGTWLCMNWFFPSAAVLLAIADTVIHYHIDWIRVNVCYVMNWTTTNSKYWWWTIGVDEFLHYMTYIGLIAVMVL